MTTNAAVSKESAPHYTWGDGCDSWVLANEASLCVKQEAMPSGTKERLHFHSAAQQFFFILKGTASFYVNDEKQLLKEHQGLLVLPEAKHFIANESNDLLSFLVISQPSTQGDRTNVEEGSEHQQ